MDDFYCYIYDGDKRKLKFKAAQNFGRLDFQLGINLLI